MARKKTDPATVADAPAPQNAPEAAIDAAPEADGDGDDEPPTPPATPDAIALDPGAEWSPIAQPDGFRATFAAARDLEIRRTGAGFTSTETLRAGDVRVIGWRDGETLDARAI
jgi:hypothetical protein